MKKRIYISGPMTGLPNENFPRFNAVAEELRSHGHDVVNPAELVNYSTAPSWSDYLRQDIAELVKCDAVVLLEGWEESKGALLEVVIAWCLGLRFFYPNGCPYYLNPGALVTLLMQLITTYPRPESK